MKNLFGRLIHIGEFSVVNPHEKYMRRAIELARLGIGHVSPNPMVGCVIVHEDRIIGEGYHQKYGEAHAEVNAVNSVSDSSLFPDSTAYVTLEPCAHHGKTPPCADLLIEKKMGRVIVGCQDSFDQVDGEGIKRMRAAGIEVEVGILENECRRLNKCFFTFVEKKRPFVILKWAQTEDGFIARENYDSKWISNSQSRQLVHKWRAEEDAILVGKNTAKYDNPSLTVREWVGQNPTRIVIDNQLELSTDLNLFDGSVPTIVMNLQKDEESNNLIYAKYDGSIQDLLSKLYQSKIQSVIIEGGSKILQSFIEQELWDEARVFTSHQKFVNGIAAPSISGELISHTEIIGDKLQFLERH